VLGRPPDEQLAKTPPDEELAVQECLWYTGDFAVELVIEDGIVIRGSLADEQSGKDLEPLSPGESVFDTVRRLLHL
jgi:hypothetical protein